MDVLTPEQRRLNMSRVRGRDTKIELFLRKGLHARGLRFRVNRRDLPGRPDVVLTKYRVCVFVHGCFWHGHDCALFKLPATRRSFWRRKIGETKARDESCVKILLDAGWRVLLLWECATRGPRRLSPEAVLEESFEFIVGAAGWDDDRVYWEIASPTPQARPDGRDGRRPDDIAASPERHERMIDE